MSLLEKVVIVTGSGNGIGRAIALAYAQQGSKIVVADKTKKDIEETVQLIQEQKGTCHGVTVDVRDRFQIESLMQETVQKYGTIDIPVSYTHLTLPTKA